MTRDLWARRPFFDDDHEDLRATVRGLLARAVVPYGEEWDAAGIIPRDPWLAAGEAGLLGLGLEDDYAFRCVVIEECARVGATSYSSGLTVHADIALPYVVDMAGPEQEARWVPGLTSGELIGAIAMTEPGTGSDLRGIRTSARRDGDAWILNGAKTFITNGINSDLVVVVARTDPSPEAGSRAFSLFVVERGMPGFERGRNLDKVGLKAQDTAELTFSDVVLTDDHLLSEVGDGMRQLMVHLPLERIGIAVTACAGARAALAWTVDYVRERAAFGRTVADFQHTQFAIAEMVTALDVTQAYVDQAVLRLNARELTAVEAAQAKWWATEMHKTVVDRCVQLFGGYGYMLEYPIARAYLDTRVTTIYGGTTEIMKQIVARDVLGVR
ncbi:acyl-CoA dehydrogenase [Nocardioides sp. MAH-18]|uniref:Acyl-[acyl-carrier-protein] dehydrogenase MbtN n=1 Tax=Nocardioides agri TaxID=2682843 RepID=A0A6L6XPX7_9ACTN|nr:MULTISPECIES: acyl-CoA dehydrogenase family protein [unclassified Nocardioides]MBA2953781.1 acyl-CoA dehydrogenase family protein [Nocardioides sp. CGMCC 1.13656]MVQ48646.1 acyl-CoA dehydrogenase [Nocardioides sp. MAH-18]